jgi:hypothetical protein
MCLAKLSNRSNKSFLEIVHPRVFCFGNHDPIIR